MDKALELKKVLNSKSKQNKFVSWIKSWSPYAKNKTINTLMYLIMVFVILGMNYCFIFGAFIPKFFVLDFFIMLFSVSPIFFFKGTLFDRIYLPIVIFLIMILACVNVNYYKFFDMVFTLKDLIVNLRNAGQVGYRLADYNWLNICLNFLLFGLFLSSLLVFNIKFNFKETEVSKQPSRKKVSIFAGVCLGLSLIAYELNLAIWTQCEKNDGVNSVDYVNYAANWHFNNMGMASYYIKEIRQLCFNKGLDDKQTINYLSSAKLVNDNYTNLLQSNRPNLFMICIETGDRLMVNQYTTPTLYSLLNEGIDAKHNYSFNHTNISNALGFTGSTPPNQVLQTRGYNLPYSLPQVLDKNGYETRYYCDIIDSEDGYDDIGFMKKQGFKKSLNHNDIIPGREPWHYKNHNFERDSIVAGGIVKDIDKFFAKPEGDKYYGHWMTNFMHMDNKVKDGNKKLLNQLYKDYGEKLDTLEKEGKWSNPCTQPDSKERYYIYTLKTMDFDDALKQLMDYFYGDKATDERKNTLMVLYGDHSWFEIGDGQPMSMFKKKIHDKQNIKLYSTVLGFYHPILNTLISSDATGLFETSTHNLNKMTSPACIVPTVLDLLGIPFNAKLYQDQSIFDLHGKASYDKSYDDIYYSGLLKLYMNEQYVSSNGAYVTKIVEDDGTSLEFNQKLHDKDYQLRIIDSIYYNDFFNRNKYEDLIPKE